MPVDGPHAGKQVYSVNRIGELVHFGRDVTYEVTELAEADQPAGLTQVVEQRAGGGPSTTDEGDIQ